MCLIPQSNLREKSPYAVIILSLCHVLSILAVDKNRCNDQDMGWFLPTFFPHVCCQTHCSSFIWQPQVKVDAEEIQLLPGICALPCHELLLGRPFSQMSEMCLASGILSLHEWDRPFDLHTHAALTEYYQYNIILRSSYMLSCSCCFSGVEAEAGVNEGKYEDAAEGDILSDKNTMTAKHDMMWHK